MNVVYSSSDSYAPIAGTSICSLLENNQDAAKIEIYLIDNNISTDNKEKLKNMVQRYGRELIFVSHVDLNKKANLEIEVGRWNISTFYRLFLCSILPDNVDRAIFLDCDTIVRHSLNELWSMDLEDKIVAAVDDCRSDQYKLELGLSPDNTYTNNGVLLLDLKRWRELNVEKDFLEYIVQNNGDITYVDQGVLNGVLSKKGLVKVIHTKYNAMTVFFDFNYKNLLKVRRPEHHLSYQEYKEAVSDPYIVHFTSCFLSGTRPWNEKNNHPFQKEYLFYKSISPWSDMKQLPDNRKIGKKMMTKICNVLPKPIMIAGISLIHSKIYPMFRNIKKEKRIVS